VLLKQREEARLALSRQDQLLQVKVVSAAVPPRSPVRPNRPLYLAVGMLLGAVVALGWAFFAESLDNSIDSAEDVRRVLGFPVLASIADTRLLVLTGDRPGRAGVGGPRMAATPVGVGSSQSEML